MSVPNQLVLVLIVSCIGAIGCGNRSTTPVGAQIAQAPANVDAVDELDIKVSGDADSPLLATRAPLASSVQRQGPFGGSFPSDEKRMFTRLDADETGVTFVHKWTPPEAYERLLESSFAGGGVAVGDYDGDGLPDVYLSRPFGGGRLYRNLGEFKFEDVTEVAGLSLDKSWGTGCSFVDINNDGALDLYLCGYDCPNRLFVNQQNGTFREEAESRGLAIHGASVMASFSDYDNDGDLDVFLVRNRFTPPDENGSYAWAPSIDDAFRQLKKTVLGPVMPDHLREYWEVIFFPERGKVRIVQAGQRAMLMQNDGSGKFVDVSDEAGIDDYGMTLSATWMDYNHDGHADLYVANDFYGADRFYRNNGDGTFDDVARDVLPHIPWFSMGTDVADVNNDGLLDFMASDMSGTSHYKQKLGMGDMSDSAWFLDSSDPPQYMRNAVYVNTGSDRFLEVAHMAGLSNSDWTWAVKFADLDCDGWCDLFISNGMTGDWLNSDIRAEHGGGFDTLRHHVSRKDDANLAFRNLGDLEFADRSASWGLNLESVSFGAGYGDFDGDGDLDLIVNNFDEPASVYRNDVAVGNRVILRLRGTESNSQGIGALVRIYTADGVQSRYLTLARGFMSNDQPVIQFGLGDVEVIDKVKILWPSQRVQTLRDIAANFVYTVTEPSVGSQSEFAAKAVTTDFVSNEDGNSPRHNERPFDDFASQPLLPNKLSQLGPGLAFGDVDGDGVDELYMGGAAGSAGRLFTIRNQSDTIQFRKNSTPAFEPDSPCEDMGALLFDADGDGDLDLYVVSGGVESGPDSELLQDRLYINSGTGEFEKAVNALPQLKSSGSCVVAADFDRDGDLDLFVGGRVVPGSYPQVPQSTLLLNESGQEGPKFTEVTDKLALGLKQVGMVTGAVWSDANDDGWIDLLVTTEWGPVGVFLNEQGVLRDHTEDSGLESRKGWWNGISAGDIDKDGDIDYLVTNFGLNTKYHPTTKKPAMLFYGEFDETGKSRIIEAKCTADGFLPVRGKSCSQNAMPFISSKLPTYHEFASSLLNEIYTPKSLVDAYQVDASELRHGMLINDGQARFQFQPLPRIAQVAPAFGSAIADFNGDGNADAYVVHNFFTPQRETGRMDGGVSQLMLGDGRGELAAVPSRQSGLLVPGDAKSLIVADLVGDGRLGVMVGVNNGRSRVFQAQKAAKRLRKVLLQGDDGNPTGVGARVRIQLTGGENVTREVHAGDGYLSQSGAAILLAESEVSPVEMITVRWPDGSTSKQPVEEGATGDIVVRKVRNVAEEGKLSRADQAEQSARTRINRLLRNGDLEAFGADRETDDRPTSIDELLISDIQ